MVSCTPIASLGYELHLVKYESRQRENSCTFYAFSLITSDEDANASEAVEIVNTYAQTLVSSFPLW